MASFFFGLMRIGGWRGILLIWFFPVRKSGFFLWWLAIAFSSEDFVFFSFCDRTILLCLKETVSLAIAGWQCIWLDSCMNEMRLHFRLLNIETCLTVWTPLRIIQFSTSTLSIEFIDRQFHFLNHEFEMKKRKRNRNWKRRRKKRKEREREGKKGKENERKRENERHRSNRD